LAAKAEGLQRLTLWFKSFIPYPTFGPLIAAPSLFDLLSFQPLPSATVLYGIGDGRSFSNDRGAPYRSYHLIQIDVPSRTFNEFKYVSTSSVKDISTGTVYSFGPP